MALNGKKASMSRRFTGDSDFLTKAIDPGAGMISDASPNLLVLLTVCLDMIRIVTESGRRPLWAHDLLLKSAEQGARGPIPTTRIIRSGKRASGLSDDRLATSIR
jgi:hypothetical protein